MSETKARGLLRTAVMAIAVAAVLATIVLFIAQAATDNLAVIAPGSDVARDIGFGDVLFSTVMGGIVGAVLAWATNRFAARPRRAFLGICVVGLVLYGIVPFLAAEDVATGVWLNLMHLSVALPIVGGLAMHLPDTRG